MSKEIDQRPPLLIEIYKRFSLGIDKMEMLIFNSLATYLTFKRFLSGVSKSIRHV